MSRHEGVSCDSCLKGNFRGRRYKCLVCYDYDLCSNCYENGVTTTRHSAGHAMQCILTRSDHELFYGGDTSHLSSSLHGDTSTSSYTCPFCAKLGYTEATLVDHVASNHVDATQEVVCPICASLPGGDPNHVTDDFSAHLTLEHRSGPRDLISFLDSPNNGGQGGGGSRGGGVSGRGGSGVGRGSISRPLGVRRVPHASRDVSGSGRARRTANIHNPNPPPSALSTLSPSAATSNARDSVDPIAELLSQLSGVRRATTSSSTSSSSQLHQLQMQLQLERQQAQQQRSQTEQRAAAPRIRSGFAFGGHPTSTSTSAAVANNLPSLSTAGGLANSGPVISNPHFDGESVLAASSDSRGQGYLLRQSSSDEESLSEGAGGAKAKGHPNKSQFVQDLILSTLMVKQLKVDEQEDTGCLEKEDSQKS